MDTKTSKINIIDTDNELRSKIEYAINNCEVELEGSYLEECSSYWGDLDAEIEINENCSLFIEARISMEMEVKGIANLKEFYCMLNGESVDFEINGENNEKILIDL